jgi:hypothetical protein
VAFFAFSLAREVVACFSAIVCGMTPQKNEMRNKETLHTNSIELIKLRDKCFSLICALRYKYEVGLGSMM